MPKITGSTGVVGIKISCSSSNKGETGYDGSDVCQVVLSFQFPEQDEPTQIGVPLYGRNYNGEKEPGGKGDPNNPAPGVGGGGSGRGENVTDLAARIAAALKTEVGKNNFLSARAADIVIETRSVSTKKRQGGGGGSSAAGADEGGRTELFLRIILPGVKNVDGTAQDDGGKVRIIGIGPESGGVGVAAGQRRPPPRKNPISILDPTKGWKGVPKKEPRRKPCKCEDAIGLEAAPVPDQKKMLEESPPQKLTDPGDTGWQPEVHGVG